MDWDDLKVPGSEGWLLANHTRTHPLLGELIRGPEGAQKCIREIEGAREEMDAQLGQRTRHFAYPTGSWNEEVEAIIKRNHDCARHWNTSAAPVYVTRDTDPYRIPCINLSAQSSVQQPTREKHHGTRRSRNSARHRQPV